MTGALLELDSVSMTYTRGGLLSRTRVEAVIDVGFRIDNAKPEIFSIIGESGSGKSTLARIILALQSPTRGTVRFKGRDLSTVRTDVDRHAFMTAVQPVFQNPFEAFNPLKRLDRYLYATCRRYRKATGEAAIHAASDAALRQVGLSLAEICGRYPHELSGGQLQRVAIARALASGPSLLIADEPVSMVDASLRASIVNLFRKLRDELGLSIVYITHDLATAYSISDRIIIMQKGRVVESGEARAILSDPKHPYSKTLKESVLEPLAPGARPLFAR
jgi:peptide/nickel transport system ATP-binding protein